MTVAVSNYEAIRNIIFLGDNDPMIDKRFPKHPSHVPHHGTHDESRTAWRIQKQRIALIEDQHELLLIELY